MTYVLALLAACANATSSVLQRKANRDMPKKDNLSWKLIRDLLREPVWFGGVLALIAGFLLQATALGTGSLAVVEPILVLELPVTLILASRVFRAPMGRREWISATAMAAGLGGLLYALSPSAGNTSRVRWQAWAIGIAVSLALVGVLAAWARRGETGWRGGRAGDGSRQAAVLGVAGGSAFGLTAALMKGMTQAYAHGFGALFTAWELYAMIATGILGLFLVQSALNAGRLLAAQPGLTLSDPIVAVLWGMLIFGDRVRSGLFILVDVICLAVMTAAVLALARSPLLGDRSSGPRERGGAPQRAEAPERDPQ